MAPSFSPDFDPEKTEDPLVVARQLIGDSEAPSTTLVPPTTPTSEEPDFVQPTQVVFKDSMVNLMLNRSRR